MQQNLPLRLRDKDLEVVLEIGSKFTRNYLDGCPTWEVMKHRAEDLFECMIVGGQGYDVGSGERVMRIFTLDQIKVSLFDDLRSQMYKNTNTAFYASLRPGQTVHYMENTDCFLRCEVVEENGLNTLLVRGLVGSFRQLDLTDESIVSGWVGQKFCPHASFIYENEKFSKSQCIDPRELSLHPITPKKQDPHEALFKELRSATDQFFCGKLSLTAYMNTVTTFSQQPSEVREGVAKLWGQWNMDLS